MIDAITYAIGVIVLIAGSIFWLGITLALVTIAVRALIEKLRKEEEKDE
jgi:hypothetical protein